MYALNQKAQLAYYVNVHLHIEHVRPLLKALHWLPVKDRIIYKIGTFVFCLFVFVVPSHHTCHVSLYTLLAHSVSVQKKKLFLVQDEKLRALVTGRSLFRLPLAGTTFLLTSDTAVLSHSSKLLVKLFSLLLPTLAPFHRHWMLYLI